MDLPHAQKAIKAAWILGVVKGIGTLCLVIYSTCIETVYGVGFEGLVDVAIPLGLSFGIYRRSRVCAVLMVCYDLVSIGAVQVDQAKGVAVNSGFLLVLLYFFFQGARGSFAYHRLTRQEAATLPDSSPPAIEAVSPTTPNVTAPRSETTPVHAYFILQNDELEGPYGIEELRSLWNSGVVTGETFYCEEGYDEWLRLEKIGDQLQSPPPPPVREPELISSLAERTSAGGNRAIPAPRLDRPALRTGALIAGTFALLGIFGLVAWLSNKDGTAKPLTGTAVANGLAETKARADKGDAQAQYRLGYCYYLGEGVGKDAVEALKWWRKAAEQGQAYAQNGMGHCYLSGEGVAKDAVEAVKWLGKAAEQGLAGAQYDLGYCYYFGEGVGKDAVEAVKWWRKAAEQGQAYAQNGVGHCYLSGEGVAKDAVEAVKWLGKAAEQGLADAQYALGSSYSRGEGVTQDAVEAYKWWNLAAGNGNTNASRARSRLESKMTPGQIAEAQRRSTAFLPRNHSPGWEKMLPTPALPREGWDSPKGSASGFFITDSGFLITCEHAVSKVIRVRILTGAGLVAATVVKVDSANDLALLKVEGKFATLPVVSSRAVKMGGTVVTVGFPNIGLQGFAPKLAKGEIAALSGAQDDPRYFQISVPVQPGNSGGALVDERGNVVGVVAAKLNVAAAVATSGALPENVNYAVKSSLLLSFLESVPEVAAKLKEPSTKDRKFEDVVKSAEKAAVLVLVY